MAMTRAELDRGKTLLEALKGENIILSNTSRTQEEFTMWLKIHSEDLIACADVALEANITIPGTSNE